MPDKIYLVSMVVQPKNNFLDSLLVVIVIYKKKIDESPSYLSLSKALANSSVKTSLFIYDNSPAAQELPESHQWITDYAHDSTNPGVSKAYNEGFAVAKEKGKKWLLLADQDTVFPQNAFEQYQRCLSESAPSIVVPILKDQLGYVSPLRFYLGGGQRVRNFVSNTLLLRKYLFHNSGLLISTEAFEKAGGYDENLPLDFSDFSFVFKLHAYYKTFALADFTCVHSLAATSKADLHGRLHRFESYVSAGRHFRRNYTSANGMLPLRIFLRGVKLALQYRRLKFIKLLFR